MKIFEDRLRPLIVMFYHTDTQNQRFLAWIKAKPYYTGLNEEMVKLNKMGII